MGHFISISKKRIQSFSILILISSRSHCIYMYIYQKKKYKKLYVNGKNGRINITSIQANDASVSSSNGRLTLDNLQSPKLNAETNNGRIHATNIHAAELRMASDNGNIELERADTAEAKVESNNGRISLTAVEGEIVGKTDNGRISLVTDQIDRPMDLTSHNGNIKISTKNKPKNALFDVEVHNGKASLYGSNKNTLIFGEGKNIIKLSTHNGKITVD
ncbi:DUF4097 family beta strand repeat-containing protein [Virgibacillus halophilus]|uniref:DUF4097 family beta strand repeat-containing protein n=1 Tax=Tigheibacillus halophilus TaxID=361280 RepID=A0ABU5C6X7_9BACI|nr:DUF4097 family beta strand repeat-containing protein [Virgibacillus halophilus]